MFECNEAVRALGQPIVKLLEAISGAVGKMYEPRFYKKMAEARAHEIKVISQEARENIDIPILYESSGLVVDTRNLAEISKRALSRLKYQEIKKQENIESVIGYACQDIKNVTNVSDEAVSPDWVIRFFNSVEDISEAEMQKIWGRILSGEVQRPHTYSYRLLEKLKNMNQREAEHFQLVSSLALGDVGEPRVIVKDDELLKEYQIPFTYFLELEECGLLSSQELSLQISSTDSKQMMLFNSKIAVIVKGIAGTPGLVSIPVFALTSSGSQLVSVVQPKENCNYVLEAFKKIKKVHKGFAITAHKINIVDNEGKVDYCEEDLLQEGD